MRNYAQLCATMRNYAQRGSNSAGLLGIYPASHLRCTPQVCKVLGYLNNPCSINLEGHRSNKNSGKLAIELLEKEIIDNDHISPPNLVTDQPRCFLANLVSDQAHSTWNPGKMS